MKSDAVSHVLLRKQARKGHVHGGLAILIKNEIRQGVRFLQTTSSEYQWFLLKKEFFGFANDIYVCCVYFSPRNSTFNAHCANDNDLFEQINVDMSQHSKHGKILICGDLNARTGQNEPDFILNDDSTYIPLSENYIQDTNLQCRNSQDKVIDKRGRDLLDFCVESQMRILNGRSFGDMQGMYTSYNYNGNSVVDYMIASESLISQVLYFNVSLNKPRLSDHSQIGCKILANFSMRDESVPLLPFPVKYKWSEASSGRFKDALCSCSIKQKILDLENLDANSSTDTLIGKLENIIIATADISLRKKCKKKSKKRHTPKKWYDYELYNMRRKLDQKGFLYAKYPCDPFVRGSYYKFRKLYVKLCKRKRKEYKGQIVEKLEQLHENDPKAYWKLLEDLKNEDVTNSEPQISPEEWVDHFSNLNT